MLKWICAAALAAGFASPAMAQKPGDHPAKLTKPFDQSSIQQGLAALKQGGQCTMTYVISDKGRAKDIKADCTVPDMAPYVTKTVETAEWDPEVFDGQVFDSRPQRQIFKFGSQPAAGAPDPRGEKAPVVVKGLDANEVERAIGRVALDGAKVERCDPTFTVGADGKTKDIVANCKPQKLDPLITDAIRKMEYTPGQKDGKPVDWPNMTQPMNLASSIKQN
ncbi:MAG TPA: hypothetical protein VG942_15460 [Hyphomonadaceae bacterium]|nr:hypothetical protein [Hyphomonadaceae bacterium]